MVKRKGEGVYSSSWETHLMSFAIWDYKVLPATQHK